MRCVFTDSQLALPDANANAWLDKEKDDCSDLFWCH